MKLQTYNSLQEKNDIFKERYQRIDTWNDLEALLIQDISSESVFRGMYEAKYKNYTSAQRYFLTHELDKSGLFISQIIQNEVKELLSSNNMLSSYFDSLGVEKNWFLLNSFLQHYGGITPLLDFSKNPLVALYFMQENAKFSAIGGDDIDNYCSLYFLKVNELETINEMINKVVERFSEKFENMSRKIDSAKEKYPKLYKMTVEAMEAQKQNAKSYIETFLSEKLFDGYEGLQRYMEDEDLNLFIDNKSLILESNQLNYHKQIAMTPNLNSIAQEGVFVMRAGKEPLENKYVHCIDIHKSLIPSIRTYLNDKEITKEQLFPQEEKIASQALKMCITFCTKSNKQQKTKI